LNEIDTGSRGAGRAISSRPITGYYKCVICENIIRVMTGNIPKLPVIIFIGASGVIRKPNVPDTKQVNL
jgi:hypothetical protein